MKLIAFIDYLLDPKKLDQLYTNEHVNTEIDALLIYMTEVLDIQSELQFFSIEETEDEMVYKKNSKSYVQFFSIDYAVELIEDFDLKNKGL
jgi:hypothetical protein